MRRTILSAVALALANAMAPATQPRSIPQVSLHTGLPGTQSDAGQPQGAPETELKVTGKASGMLGGGQVSPDGRYISFSDQLAVRAGGTGNLAIWDIQTGDSSIVTKFSNAKPWADGFAEESTWFPDGEALAYAWRAEGAGRSRELRIVEVASGQHRTLLRSSEGVDRLIPFAVSPDRRHILVAFGSGVGAGTVGATELALIAVSDASKRTLRSFDGGLPGGGAFSPDGRSIAFDHQPKGDSASRDVVIMAAESGGKQQVVGDPASHDVLLGWLPDGRLLFTSFRDGQADALAVPLINGEAREPATIVRRNVGEVRPQGVTRDGRVFLQRILNLREILVVQLDPATGKALKPASLLPGTKPGMYRSEPAWSPDGGRIAYVESGPGLPQGVIIHTVATGVTRRYDVGVRNIDWPLWQPDGRAFIFDGSGADNIQRTHRLWLDSGRVEPLIEGLVFGVSPDGKFFYHGGPGYDLTRRAFGDGTSMTLATRAELGAVQGSTLSPDGRWFAYLTGAGRQRGIAIRSADGKSAKILLENVAVGYPRIAWTHDSRHVVFNRNPGGLHRISVEGGEPDPLNVVVQGVIGEKSVSPDGRRIAFGVSRNESQLIVWSNLVATPQRR